MPGRLYNLARWKKIRINFLSGHHLCRFCEAAGRVTLARVIDA